MVIVLSLLTAAFTELASNTAVTTILMPIVGCMVMMITTGIDFVCVFAQVAYYMLKWHTVSI